MNQIERLREIVATYQKHGWNLRRVLLTGESRKLWDEAAEESLAALTTSTIDALWFSRTSHNEREAWELRLVAESPYALFETFENDETEEQRDEARQEMEAIMREYTAKN
jgi:hypothetical protein